jgi:hypothetical protein
MEYGKVVPMLTPTPADRAERRNWPFDALTVGTQFLVAADEKHACKTALSRYNKQHKASLKSYTNDDGELVVYMPGTATAGPEQSTDQAKQPMPGEFEFVSHLISAVDPMASFTMPCEQYGNRYDEFAAWIVKLNASQPKQFTISKDDTLITIQRLPDAPNFT